MGSEHLESTALARAGFRHAFFTRRGGRSAPPFDSLHFGAAGQDAETLAANVEIAAARLAVAPSKLYLATQVHGRAVVAVRGSDERAAVLARSADALTARAVGVACAVKVADCVPILVGDRRTGAVAAVHAGWQGTVAGAVAAAILALRQEVGNEGDLVAAIGPHIESCCFEIGDDVATKLQACAPDRAVIDRTRGPRPHGDLRAIIRSQLRAAGVHDSSIDDVQGCTRCDRARFFSFRRDRETSGRQLAAIVVRA